MSAPGVTRYGVALLACCLAAVPAQAQEGLGYSLASQVPTLCSISGEIYAASANPSAASTISGGGSATVRVDLTRPDAQEIGRIGVKCNGGNATVSISSSNDFRLINGAGGANREIPFTVSIAGTSVSDVSTSTSYIENETGSDLTRSLSITVGRVNFLLLQVGQYTDTLTLSVTPNS